MNRRDFLKIVGAAIVSPALLRIKEYITGTLRYDHNPVDVFQFITGAPDSECLQELRRYIDEPVRPDIYDGNWHEVCAVQTAMPKMKYKDKRVFLNSGHQVYIDGWKVKSFLLIDDFQIEGFIQTEENGVFTDRFRFKKI